jgi:iron complex transport system substrate-binding protein
MPSENLRARQSVRPEKRGGKTMKKTLALILALVLALSLAGCGGSSAKPAEETPAAQEPAETPAPEVTPEPTPEPGPVDVTDMTGRTVHLEKPAKRIVALTASDCEILYAVGAGDLLVARGSFCDYPEEVKELPALGSGRDTNVEDIIAMEPDLLIMSTMAQTEEQVKALEDAGVAVAVSDAQTIEGTYEAIRLIGALTGMEENAEQVVADMQTVFDTLQKKVQAMGLAEDEKPTIYFEVTPPYYGYGLWVAGSGTFMNEIADMLGLVNIFADVEGWAVVSEEQVLELDPEYIVTITMYEGQDYQSAEAEIMGRAGWEDVLAVENEDILLLPDNELSRPIPRLAQGAQILFDFVYNDA